MQVISDNLMYSATCFYASQGGGSSGGLSGTFPSEPITADSENFFYYSNSVGTGRGLQDFFAYTGDVAYCVSDQGGYVIIDKDIDTVKEGQSVIVKFKEPTVIKTLQIKDTMGYWSICGTNASEAVEPFLQSGADYFESLGQGEVFIKPSANTVARELTDFSINSNGNAYQYYVFRSGDSRANTYEIALKTE